ncbi:MAG: DJ-1/PfpI family protein [Candidatus Altiarchaeota archaeon]
MQKPNSIAILLFNGSLPLDFVGPHHVFTHMKRYAQPDLQIRTIGTESPVETSGHLRIIPDEVLTSETKIPQGDGLLIIPGGKGARDILENGNPLVEEYIRKFHEAGNMIATVCTGALVAAKAGILKDCRATTHGKFLHLLEGHVQEVVRLGRNQSYVENDSQRIITSGGVMKGLPMVLDMAQRFSGPEVRRRIQDSMKYPIVAQMLDTDSAHGLMKTTRPKRRLPN